MAIEGIPGIKPITLQPLSMVEDIKQSGQIQNQFQNILVDTIKNVNNDQIENNQLMQAFLNGEGPALHTVMLNAEKANLSLEFAVQMRNKVMEAYQEVMRMQI